MTKQCKYVLKKIKLLTGKTSREVGYENDKNIIYELKKPNEKLELAKYHGELNTLISSLIDNGHLTTTRFGIQLTHKGIHPFRVSFEEVKRFLFKSVIIPIIISVLASLATMWLKGLL